MPTQRKAVTLAGLPNNLGIVIKAELVQLRHDQLAALPVPSVTAATATDASKSR